jgi:hypothetical protein
MRSTRRGAVLLEASLVGIVLVALVVGAFNLGRIAWTQSTLTFAAARTARFALVNGEFGSRDDVLAVARKTSVGVPLDDPNVQTQWDAADVNVVITAEIDLIGLDPMTVTGRARLPRLAAESR